MKKNFKRWLAFILAVALVATSAVYSSGTSLKATSEEAETQTEQKVDGTEVNQGQAERADTNSGAGTQATDETGNQKQEIVVEHPPQDTIETQEEVAATEYDVIFHKPSAEGGTLKVWADGAEQKDASYDGNGVYTEKFPEGTLLNFQITENDKYTVEQVTDQNGVQIAPISVNEKVYSYQMFVSANTEITTLYKVVPQNNTEEPEKEDKTPAADTKKDTVEDTKKDTAEEKDVEYTLHISHVLHTSIGNFHDEAEVKLSKEDFTDGRYDVLSQTSTKEGIVLSTDSLLVKMEDFNRGNEASVSVEYEVAEGFKAVTKTGKAARAIYVGTFDDVEVVPIGQIPVTVAFTYENGTLAAPSQTIMVVEGSGTEGGYAFSYRAPGKEGYAIGIADDDKATYKLEGQTITANLPNTAKSGSVNVRYLADDADYMVNYLYQKADGTDAYDSGTPETKSGKAGELTEVQPPKKDGFTAQPVEQQEIKANGSTTVEVKYVRNTYSVSYNSNGGTYVSPLKGVFEQTVKVYGDGAQAKDLKRQGYVFDGWYSDKECTVKAEQSVKLTENQTVYAKWNPGKANYTVVYYKAKYDNSTNFSYYVYDSSRVVEGVTVGTEAVDTVKKSYPYNEFDHTETQEVKPDNTTVVSSYYRLIKYTLNFKVNGTNDWLSRPLQPDAYFEIDGKNIGNLYSIEEVVLGQNISDKWPEQSWIKGWTDLGNNAFPYSWFPENRLKVSDSQITRCYEVTPELITPMKSEDTGRTFRFDMEYKTLAGVGHVNFWLQNKDGIYEKSKKYSQAINFTTAGLVFDGKDIVGYSIYKEGKVPGVPPSSDGITYPGNDTTKHDYNFYYTMDKYSITYNYKSTLIKTKAGIQEGTDISSDEYNFTPSKDACGITGDYEFVGWYNNIELRGEPYVFKTLDENTVLYAKWKAPDRNVTLDYNYGDKTDVLKVPNANVAELPTLEREGYLFEGWYTDKDCKKLFDYSQPIEKDMTLYAKWTANTNTTYTVRYVVEDTTTGGGGYKDIADKKTGTGVVGATIIEKSKLIGGETYGKYVVNKSSQALELKSAASKNVILFVYSPQKNLKYTVRYVYEDRVIKEENNLESVASQFRVYPKESIVKELVKEGYAPNEAFVNAILGTEEKGNIITFTLSEKAYTITYKGLEDVTGWASGKGTDNPNKTSYTNVDEFTLVNPKKEGYTFDGWKLSGGQVASSDVHDEKNVFISKGSKGNLIFTATWKEDTYTVKYDVNGGKESIANKTDVKWSDKGLLPAVTPTREYYTFDRWVCNYKTLNNDNAYSDFASNRQIESITFVAKWTRDWTNFEVKAYDGTYDGNRHSVEVTGIAPGEVLTYTLDPSADIRSTEKWSDTNPGFRNVTKDNGGKYPVFVKVMSADKMGVYGFESYIKINPVEIKITANDGNKQYDGTPLTNNKYSVEGKFVGSDKLETVVVEGSRTTPGEASNKVTGYTLTNNTYADNYKINTKDGLLKVTDRINKYLIEVKSKGGSETYTGNEQSVKGFDTLIFVVNGQTYRVDGIEAGTVGTDAGTYPSEITGTPIVWDSFQTDVTKQFDIKLTEGKLVIEKAVATVTADSLEKMYGSENPELTYQSEGFLNGDSPEGLGIAPKLDTTATKASTITDEGYPITFAAPDTETANYKIDYVKGILTITQYGDTIAVEAGSARRDYNGQPLTEGEVFVTGELAEGDHVEAIMSADSKRTVVGETANKFESCKILNKDAEDVTDQYRDISRIPGKLQITKADLTITADSVTKEYGEDVPKLMSTVTGLQNGETLERLGLIPKLTTNATAKSPVKDGGYPITFENPVTEAENYDLKYVPSVLKVTPSSQEVVITASNDSKIYDGTALSKATASATGLFNGDSIQTVLMTPESQVTNVENTATPNVIATATIKNGAGEGVTTNYSNIKIVAGELKVKPADITVQAGDVGKVAGQEDPELTYRITMDSEVVGQKAALSGTLTRKAGEAAGEYKILKGELTLTNNGAFLASNYSLIVLAGIFKITAPDYSITKSISNTSFLKKFEANEKVEFDIVVTNNNKYPVKNLTVTDNLTGASGKAKILENDAYTVSADGAAIIAELQGGASISVKARYTVSQDDIDKQNAIVNTATVADNKSDPKESDKVEVPIAAGSAEVTGTKEIIAQAGVGENGYKVGETVKFKITVNNAGTVTLTKLQVTEKLEGAVITAGVGYTTSDGKIASINEPMKPGATLDVYAEYTVKQSDVNDGKLKNIAHITGKGPDGSTSLNGKNVVVDVPTENERVKVITNKSIINQEDATGKDGNFAVGDLVKFEITVENNGNTTLKGITVGEDQLPGATIVESEDSKYTVTDKVATIASINPEEIATVNAQYKIKQTDVDNGKATNIATINIPNKEKPQDPSIVIITEKKEPKISINKGLTADTAQSEYKFGDTAYFDITVTNEGNVTLKNVTVAEMDGATIETSPDSSYSISAGKAVIENLAVGDTAVVKASYTVTQQDINKGTAVNTATVKADGLESENAQKQIPLAAQTPKMTSEKSLVAPFGGGAGGAFRVGETAYFEITVENIGNVTLNNVKVKEMAGALVTDGDGYKVMDGVAKIDTLEVGTTVTVKAQYTVTQADVDNGGTTNNATVTGEGQNKKDPEPNTPREEIPTEKERLDIVTVKTVTNKGTGENGAFKSGEQANFTITVTNTGNTTLKNITVADQLEGAAIVNGNGYTVNGDGQALFESLAPGNAAVVYAQYTVTQANVDNGGTTNVAAVTAEGPGENRPDPQNPSVEVTTDTQKPDLTTSKSLTNEGTGEGGAFKAGETAEFEISVANTGNVTQKNITVAEGLDGAVILEGNGYTVEDGKAIINELAVGASVKVNAEYTITQTDIDRGATIMNTAIVDAGENNPQDPQEPIPTEKPDANLGVSKTILNAQDRYLFGETIQYQITTSNDGNVTLNNVVINDLLTNASGNVVFEESNQYSVEGNTITVKQLAPGASVVINCSYTVTRADAGNTITNTAAGTSDETTTPKSDTTDGTAVGALYNLTIHYADAAGATVAADYTGQYGEREAFSVTSPTIAGYTMNYTSISSDADGMPTQNLEFTVTYTANPVVTPVAPTPPTDVVTPIAPETVTPAEPTLVTVPTTPVPSANVVVTPNEDGDYDLTPVEDVEAPSAKTNLDGDHACCILHFLLMLLALIILMFYTRSMKKRQARIFELDEKIRIEMAKRGLEEGKKDAK